MEKLNDRIHSCEKCEIYPCSLQEEVSRLDICIDCPVPCCRGVVVPLAPCEENKFEKGEFGSLKMENDEWCHYFDKEKDICTIYDIRPIICRVHSCRFIRDGKIPYEVKIIKNRLKKEHKKEMCKIDRKPKMA